MSYHDRISQIEKYAKERGISLVTVGNNVADNARLFERTRRRIAQVEGDLSRMEAYVAANPIDEKRGKPAAPVQEAASE